MRLTIRLLGTEVLHISTDPDPAPESDPERTDSTGYFLGFTAAPERPDEAAHIPDRE